MANNEPNANSTRSDKRIPKLRSRGRANRDRLLSTAQKLIEQESAQSLRFSDVFEAAGVSRGSAYRIYNGIEDLMQDLASTWINNFVAYIKAANAKTSAESWMELSDIVVAKSAAYWLETEQTLSVLPRVLSNAPQNYQLAARELTVALASIFDRHFVIPKKPDWLSVLAMYAQLCDAVLANAVRREGHISERRLREAQKICNTYLSFYLPSWLPAREESK